MYLHLVRPPPICVVSEGVLAAGAQVQQRERRGIRRHQRRGKLAGGEIPGPVTVQVEGTNSDGSDAQRKREYGPDSGRAGSLQESRPAPDDDVAGFAQVADDDW